MPVSLYNDAYWAEIRREWEETDIGITELSKKHGFNSRASISRRRVEEGWTKRADVAEARAQMADAVLDQTAIEGTAEQGPVIEGGVESVGSITLDVEQTAPKPARPPARQLNMFPPEPAAMPPMTEAMDEDVMTSLATELTPEMARAMQFRREVGMARRMQMGGLLLMERLIAILQPPPPWEGHPDDEASVLGNLQRIIRVNPEKETLAGLMAQATKTMEAGIAAERKALTPDKAVDSKGAGGAASLLDEEAQRERNRALARDMLKRLGPAGIAEVRSWAADVQKQRRQAEIEGGSNPTSSGLT